MIYTPNSHIPIGEAVKREDGTHVLRVKNPKTKAVDEITLDNLLTQVVKTAAPGQTAETRTYGKAYCDSQQIPESTLEMIVGDRAFTQIRIPGPGVIKVQWEDGSETVHKWSNPSRSESWTPEMRMAVGEKTRARNRSAK